MLLHWMQTRWIKLSDGGVAGWAGLTVSVEAPWDELLMGRF